MDEQMRNVNLSLDEIKDLMDWLSPEHDGRDFESECPSCTSYAKLSAALSQPAAAPWIEWKGDRHSYDGPLPAETVIDIRFRGGDEHSNLLAGDYSWRDTGEEDDVVAYRISAAQGAPDHSAGERTS